MALSTKILGVGRALRCFIVGPDSRPDRAASPRFGRVRFDRDSSEHLPWAGFANWRPAAGWEEAITVFESSGDW